MRRKTLIEWMKLPDVEEAFAICTGLCLRLHWSDAPTIPPGAARIMNSWLSGERRPGMASDLPPGETAVDDVCAAIHALCSREPQRLPQALELLRSAAQRLGETLETMAEIGGRERDIARLVTRMAEEVSRASPGLAQRYAFEELVRNACAREHSEALTAIADIADVHSRARRR